MTAQGCPGGDTGLPGPGRPPAWRRCGGCSGPSRRRRCRRRRQFDALPADFQDAFRGAGDPAGPPVLAAAAGGLLDAEARGSPAVTAPPRGLRGPGSLRPRLLPPNVRRRVPSDGGGLATPSLPQFRHRTRGDPCLPLGSCPAGGRRRPPLYPDALVPGLGGPTGRCRAAHFLELLSLAWREEPAEMQWPVAARSAAPRRTRASRPGLIIAQPRLRARARQLHSCSSPVKSPPAARSPVRTTPCSSST